jgi:hypothetical protein
MEGPWINALISHRPTARLAACTNQLTHHGMGICSQLALHTTFSLPGGQLNRPDGACCAQACIVNSAMTFASPNTHSASKASKTFRGQFSFLLSIVSLSFLWILGEAYSGVVWYLLVVDSFILLLLLLPAVHRWTFHGRFFVLGFFLPFRYLHGTRPQCSCLSRSGPPSPVLHCLLEFLPLVFHILHLTITDIH